MKRTYPVGLMLPHMYKRAGCWICYYSIGTAGWGFDPRQAYLNFLINNGLHVPT